MITVLVGGAAFDAERVELTGDVYRHLFRARRAAVGEPVRVVDGEGRARGAVVAAVGRARAELRLGESVSGNDPARLVELYVAPPKVERAAWLVEKATELGVAAIRFVATARAAREIGDAGLERLRRVAVAALEQCHGARLPQIDGVLGWPEFVARAQVRPWRAVLDAGGAPAIDDGSAAAALLVGPEGGFEPAELAELTRAGFATWALGRRALRVETAAIVAAGALLAPRGA
jgi:16S rRNA (uracil1498-N3)-methyltransferase